jgi:hypothetical protein
MPLPTACWANSRDEHHRRRRAKRWTWANGLEACALRQAGLGDRLPRPHRRQILQGRRRQLLALGLVPQRYAMLFPNDITYTIGQSDYHKDWFFEQVPHAKSTCRGKSRGEGSRQPALRLGEAWEPDEDMWPWNYWPGPRDHLDHQIQHGPRHRRARRLARGAGRRRWQWRSRRAVNGQSVGTIRPIATNALRYNTDKSVWHEYTLTFDAALLKQGENEMQLTVPAGELTSGVVYDYLRLELNEDYKSDGTSRCPFSTDGNEHILGVNLSPRWSVPLSRCGNLFCVVRFFSLGGAATFPRGVARALPDPSSRWH